VSVGNLQLVAVSRAARRVIQGVCHSSRHKKCPIVDCQLSIVDCGARSIMAKL
jgi:hypothetical protein